MGKGDENTDRGNWDNKADYLLSCIGYAVGLGNIWRFPYLAYDNGGGAFLIPYVIMLVFAGLPVFFMEVALGQFSSLGPTAVWKFNPFFKGVGYCMVILSMFVGIYYNVIISYTVFYFFSSFSSGLPWADCGNWWNSDQCSTSYVLQCDSVNLTDFDTSVASGFLTNETNGFDGAGPVYTDVVQSSVESLAALLSTNSSSLGCDAFESKRVVSPTTEYFNKYALNLAPDMELENMGGLNSHLVLSLIVAWIVVFFSLIRGVKSSGKVVYFTALFPYVVLVILLVRGATLEGAELGIQYYMGNMSNMTKLQEAETWKNAATQIFFSLSAAWGGLIALSSYNKFNNNCFSDAVLVCFVNCGTSIFAGFAIFTVVGHMAFKLKQPVDQVVSQGFGLAFIAYPEAISQLPYPPVWSILFFLMLFTLGLDSQFTILETVVTALVDQFPGTFHKKRPHLMFGIALVMFLIGLICCTDAGIYWVTLIDHYAAGWGLLIVAVLELFGICYVYGGNRFIEDIEMMIGKKGWWFWLYWRVCWFFISPLLLTGVLIWSLATFSRPSYDGYELPDWATAIGWVLIAISLALIPVLAVVSLVKNKGNIFKATSPASDWGPYLAQHRGTRYQTMSEPWEAIELQQAKEKLGEVDTAGAAPAEPEQAPAVGGGEENTAFDGETEEKTQL